MIGDLETEEALQYLLKLDETELQTDVRVALLRALWRYLDRNETWKIFTRAAQGPDPVIAKAASNIPQDGMTKTARQNSLKLFFLLIQHISGEVRLATLQRIAGKDVLLEDPEGILVPRLLELLQSPHEKEIEAAATALSKTYARSDPQLIANAFKTALSNRKTLKLLHETYLENCDPNVAKNMVPATQRVLEVLKTDRLGVTMRLKLIFGGLPWTDLHTHLLEIIPELHPDALVKAEKLIADEYGWRGNNCEFKEARTMNFEIKLAASKDERARRLAVEFLSAGVSDDRGWNEGQRERLLMYRGDESVMVAEAAWAVNLPEKEEEGETEESKE